MLEHHSVARDLTGTNPPAYAHCPVCGQPAISDVTRLVRGVYLANYTDGIHIWDTRWLASAA